MHGGIFSWVIIMAVFTLSYIAAFVLWMLVSRIKFKFIRVPLKSIILAAVFPVLWFSLGVIPLWMLLYVD